MALALEGAGRHVLETALVAGQILTCLAFLALPCPA